MSFELPFKLPNGWTVKTVMELVTDGVIEKPLDGNHGGIHPKSSDYTACGVPFIMASDLVYGQVDLVNCKFISNEQAKTLRKGFAKAGDVLISHKATIGRTAIVQPSAHDFLVLTPQITYYRIIKKSELSNFYLKCYFDSGYFNSLLSSWAGAGSTRAYLGITEQLKLPIVMPPYEEQIKISNLYSSIQNKLVTNKDINQTLEQMAQALFKSWFVDFEPVKAKIAVLKTGGSHEDATLAAMTAISGKDADALMVFEREHPEQYAELIAMAELFPSAMQDSELGEIPKGWHHGPLSSIATFAEGKVYVSSLTPETYISTENMLENRAGISTASSLPSVNSVPEFRCGHVLISNIRPYFKKIWLARFNGGRSADVLAFEARDSVTVEYVYNLLYQETFFNFMMLTSRGVKMPRGDKKAIMGWQCVLPDKKISDAFSKAVGKYYSFIEINNVQNKTLTQLRDTLLPKLISGEITLPEAEQAVSEVENV
ncbi:restriction endonuclease subunit S [Klebsiella oxytoca]|uniref:restriction endonuclease subunit S n=1 Tax=Klebsiella oxytoca TaxID=571 RepID=UPI001A233AAB|nr:restriction endonuclease subunit S [Klebsiella oxytoca]MEC5509109.1 restriction endonuclease subunit S [Klebsiella oxytoca]HAT1594157.1 restriction endonuclease subunit S [Klebsiella oxytoca]